MHACMRAQQPQRRRFIRVGSGMSAVRDEAVLRAEEGSEEAQQSTSQVLSVATGGAQTPRASNGCAEGSPTKAEAVPTAEAVPADAATPVAGTPAESKPVTAHVVVLSDDDADADIDKEVGSLQRDGSAQQSAAFELDVGAAGINGGNSGVSTGGAFADSAAAAVTPGPVTPAPRTPATLGDRTSSFQFSRQGSTLVRAGSSVGTGTTLPPPPRERVRTPAWTDRILYACDSDKLHQLLYDRVEGVALSDHKPVLAAFLLDAVRLDEVRMRRETEAAQRALDAVVNSTQPRCELAENLLDVGELTYGEVMERRCTLSCCGEVRGHAACFIPLPGRLWRDGCVGVAAAWP